MSVDRVVSQANLIDLKRVETVLLFIARMATVGSLAWTIAFFVLGYQTAAVVPALLSIALLAVIRLLKTGHDQVARHVFFVVCTSALWLSSLTLPPEAMMNWLQVCLAAGAFPLFPAQQEKKFAFGYLTLAAAAWATPMMVSSPAFSSYWVDTATATTYLAPFVGLTLFGTLAGLSGWFVNIGETQFRELKSEQKKIKELSAAKSNFLATMSHELRTPMNGIIGIVELLQLGELKDEQRRMLGAVQESSENLLEIIDDLVDASEISKERFSLKSDEFDLQLLLEDCIAGVTPRAKLAGVPLHLSIDQNVPVAFLGDRNRLKQVILNLLDNAIKFSITDKDKQALPVSLNVSSKDEGMLLIEVDDHGIGMSRPVVDKLFTLFFQNEVVESRRYGGTGLGLAISQRLITLMGGNISVSSEPGLGSTFRIQLPHSRVTEKKIQYRTASETADLPRVAKADFPILVVEDNEINRIVLQKQLENLGYESVQAGNGFEGLKAIQDQTFRLILTDCHMPGMNGFEMAEEIRRSEIETGKSPVPIVAVTANVAEDAQQQSEQSGMNGFLKKPVMMGDLQEVLDHWLGTEGEEGDVQTATSKVVDASDLQVQR